MPPRRRTRARTLTFAVVGFFGLLVVALGAVMAWTSRDLLRAAEARALQSQAIDVQARIDEAVREYQRLGNLVVVTGEPNIERFRARVETEIAALLRERRELAVDADEARLVDQLSTEFRAYRDERAAAEAQGASLDETVRRTRPFLERVLDTSAALQERSRASWREADLAMGSASRAQIAADLAVGLLFLFGLVVVAVGVRTRLVGPLADLNGTLASFRQGDTEVRASGGGLAETHQLAESFNDMADTIVRQRRDQLTYLAGVAHDLRNPLSVLKPLTQTLERRPEAVTPERLRRVGRQIDRLTRMVDDLLDATRIEAGQLELRPEELDLGAAARVVVEEYAPTTDIHELTLRAPERPVLVRGDPLRIEQVIGNLVSNAIKYSPAGGPVEVSVAASDGEAELAVTDAGIGIGPDEMPQLFQPFHRRPKASQAVAGAGLGLSIVRRIVKAHGGRIDVESTPGAGSTFRVWLPLAGAAPAGRSPDSPS